MTGIPESPYLTLDEAAHYARFDYCAHPTTAFRKWANRKGLPFTRRGRVLLVERRVLESFLNPQHAGRLRAVAR